MSTAQCSEPGCPHSINTALACINVTSLFRIRYILESELDKDLPDAEAKKEIAESLDFIKLHLKAYKIEEETEKFTLFSTRKKKAHNKVGTGIRRLYLTCALGHSHYYDVDCSK